MDKHEKFRIVNNGDQFKVQEYWLWSWHDCMKVWSGRDCITAEQYTTIIPGRIGIYENIEDAEAAMRDLVRRHEKEKLQKSHRWKEL